MKFAPVPRPLPRGRLVPDPSGDDFYDDYTFVQHARVSRRLRRAWRDGKAEYKARRGRVGGLYGLAMAMGLIPTRFGCDCGHCQMDRDCCGRLYPYRASVRDTKRGIVVFVHYARNV